MLSFSVHLAPSHESRRNSEFDDTKLGKIGQTVLKIYLWNNPANQIRYANEGGDNEGETRNHLYTYRVFNPRG